MTNIQELFTWQHPLLNKIAVKLPKLFKTYLHDNTQTIDSTRILGNFLIKLTKYKEQRSFQYLQGHEMGVRKMNYEWVYLKGMKEWRMA